MTLDEIQTQIAVDIDSSANPLPSTNTEYVRRRKIINRYERSWASRKNYVWNVLLNKAQVTINAGETSVVLPSGFTGKNIALSQDGYITIGGVSYRFVRYDESKTYADTARITYLLGNDSVGYTLHVKSATEEARTIEFDYYTKNLATNSNGDTEKEVMTEPTDITKCPSPEYIINASLATLSKTDDESDKGLDYERRAEQEMDEMVANENVGMFQQEDRMMDIMEIEGYDSLGVWYE